MCFIPDVYLIGESWHPKIKMAHTCTHTPPGIERRTINRCDSLVDSVPPPAGHAWYSPQEGTIVSAGHGGLELELKV